MTRYCRFDCDEGWLDRETEDIRECPDHKPQYPEHPLKGIEINDDGLRRRFTDYSEYLESKTWRKRRIAELVAADFTCQHCHTSGTRLEVHHLTYDHLGFERKGDLVVLCSKCHKAEHGISA